MDEYVIDVRIDGHKDKLKTFCTSIYSAIDSMIGIDTVDDIKSVTRTLDGKVWDVKDIDMTYLRDIRKQMDENILSDAFKTVEDLIIKN